MSERDIVKRNPIRKEELENAYQYYIKHFDEISEKIGKSLEGMKKEEIVAYYVISMREGVIHQLYIDQQMEK